MELNYSPIKIVSREIVQQSWIKIINNGDETIVTLKLINFAFYIKARERLCHFDIYRV